MPRPWRPSLAIRASYALHSVAGGMVLAEPALWPQALAAVAANHGVLTAGGLWPRSRLLGENWVRLPPAAVGRREIALTIDDGPDPEVTPRVLDLLDAAGARASFFCIGDRVLRHAALAREIVTRGHAIENHSQRHSRFFAALGPWRMHREVAAAQQSIADTVGRAPRFFRPTAGLRSPFLDPILARLDLQLATWTRRAYDTRNDDPANVCTRLGHNLAAGDILLLHDGNAARTAAGRPVILEALPCLLAMLAEANLHSATLSSAIEAPPS